MSETQTDYDTDAEPTPGPWYEENAIVKSDYEKPSAHIDEIAAVFCTRPQHMSESKANMRLIAAAGTAAQEAREMGYDPQKAVEALPELIDELEGRVGIARVKEILGALASAEGSKE